MKNSEEKEPKGSPDIEALAYKLKSLVFEGNKIRSSTGKDDPEKLREMIEISEFSFSEEELMINDVKQKEKSTAHTAEESILFEPSKNDIQVKEFELLVSDKEIKTRK